MALVCAACAAHGQDEGIFADFRTSMGEFTVRLDYERAPRAVAGFVGLATGQSGWVDGETNLCQRPFYDGTIFHRVVKDENTNGLAIQGGGLMSLSVNTNTGVVTTNFTHAGYRMLDSVTNGLSHSNGVISLANSGPNTDSSQFFITATNVPGWDGSYTVFGNVVSGLSAVASIAAVAVQGAGSRPVEDVILHSVVIRRIGVAAETFDLSAQGVPSPEAAPMRVYRSGDNLNIEVELATQTKPLLFSESTDLFEWGRSVFLPAVQFYVDPTQVLAQSVPLEVLGERYFFHVARIRYSVPLTAPASHRGRTYTLHWNTTPPVIYEARFAASMLEVGTFTETINGEAEEGQLLSGFESWTRDAYSARLVFLDWRNRQYQFTVGFNPGAVTNRFTGRVIDGGSGQSIQIDGTFTVD